MCASIDGVSLAVVTGVVLVQLDVKGCRSVQESFRRYVEKEVLSGDNQYDAGEG